MTDTDLIQGDDFEIVIPDANALIQPLRAFGYDLATAIADLIDNSITAKAQNIWLYFHWEGDKSYVALTDDGIGMSETTLVEAMRLGPPSHHHKRARTDLGRFGMGLKTASLSQAMSLTVATKQASEDNPRVRRWDWEEALQNFMSINSRFLFCIIFAIKFLS